MPKPNWRIIMPTGTETRPTMGVVLAGGQSRRMGRDKAMLHWHGRPLIEHQQATLAAIDVAQVLISGTRPGYHGIADAVADRGPLAGLVGIADTCACEADLIIIPVDMPRLSPALLTRLLHEHADAQCLCFTDHVLPMRLRIDADSRACLHALLARSEPRERSLRALQNQLHVRYLTLPADAGAQLIDCNTPAIWNEVCS